MKQQFIKLTNKNGIIHFVNIQNIIHLSERDGGTQVAFNDGSAINFSEKTDEVMNLINDKLSQL